MCTYTVNIYMVHSYTPPHLQTRRGTLSLENPKGSPEESESLDSESGVLTVSLNGRANLIPSTCYYEDSAQIRRARLLRMRSRRTGVYVCVPGLVRVTRHGVCVAAQGSPAPIHHGTPCIQFGTPLMRSMAQEWPHLQCDTMDCPNQSTD